MVVGHLNNPRGLAVDAAGHVWIAEAGKAGSHCQGTGGNATCVGLTASVSMFANGSLHRVINGLISVGGEGGIGTIGAEAVTVNHGTVWAIMGESAFGVPPSGFPLVLLNTARAELGQLIASSPSGLGRQPPSATVTTSGPATTSSCSRTSSPTPTPTASRSRTAPCFVADAGANLLARVGAKGAVRTVAYFQVPKGSPTDAVPTCVAQGPDGALYVGELLGGDFAPGHARVWRVAWSGGAWHAKVWLRGFTTIQGCGFDKWGNFYATEFQTGGLNEDPTASPLGDVVKVTPSGKRTHLGTGQLFWPSGFAAGPNGSIYVSNCSISPGSGFGPRPHGGQLVRID